MAFEVEVKAWVADPTALEAALDRHAEYAGDVQSRDIYFRQPGMPGPHLRLRDHGTRFTVASKVKHIDAGVEINDEIEFEVSDAHAFCRLLERFNFEPFAVKRKSGRTYHSGQIRLDLIEVEHLGIFIEIEILCQHQSQIEEARRELDRWVAKLGISADSIEATPYTRLLKERRPARYKLDLSDPKVLVREVDDGSAGRQGRLL